MELNARHPSRGIILSHHSFPTCPLGKADIGLTRQASLWYVVASFSVSHRMMRRCWWRKRRLVMSRKCRLQSQDSRPHFFNNLIIIRKLIERVKAHNELKWTDLIGILVNSTWVCWTFSKKFGYAVNLFFIFSNWIY